MLEARAAPDATRRRTQLMMEDVPAVDHCHNPTHYSVALQYDENKMSARRSGRERAGLIALRIRGPALNISSPL